MDYSINQNSNGSHLFFGRRLTSRPNKAREILDLVRKEQSSEQDIYSDAFARLKEENDRVSKISSTDVNQAYTKARKRFSAAEADLDTDKIRHAVKRVTKARRGRKRVKTLKNNFMATHSLDASKRTRKAYQTLSMVENLAQRRLWRAEQAYSQHRYPENLRAALNSLNDAKNATLNRLSSASYLILSRMPQFAPSDVLGRSIVKTDRGDRYPLEMVIDAEDPHCFGLMMKFPQKTWQRGQGAFSSSPLTFLLAAKKSNIFRQAFEATGSPFRQIARASVHNKSPKQLETVACWTTPKELQVIIEEYASLGKTLKDSDKDRLFKLSREVTEESALFTPQTAINRIADLELTPNQKVAALRAGADLTSNHVVRDLRSFGPTKDHDLLERLTPYYQAGLRNFIGRDAYGLTLLDRACTSDPFFSTKGRPLLAKELIKAGSDVNAENVHGKTALHRATETGNDNLVTILLEAEAERNKADAFGQTPTSLANVEAQVSSELSGLNDWNFNDLINPGNQSTSLPNPKRAAILSLMQDKPKLSSKRKNPFLDRGLSRRDR